MADIFESLKFKDEDVITFGDGIPGFDEHKEFIIVKIPEHDPFEWLVCVKNTKVRFIVINPLLVDAEYNPDVSKSQLGELGFESSNDVLVYTIVTLKEPFANSTTNFIGPLFINRRRRIGKQIVLDTDRYSVREPVIRTKGA